MSVLCPSVMSVLTSLAEYCGTSVAMIEKHYGRYINSDSREQLERLFGSKTETFSETLRDGTMR